MKVAWVVRPAEGGILIHLNHLRNGLAKQYEILVCGPEELREWAGDFKFYPIEIRDGIHPKDDLKAIWTLRQYLHTERPVLVHMHGLKGAFIGVPAAKFSKCNRLVFTAHNCLPKHASHWHQLSHGLIQRYLFNGLHRIICVSDAVRDDFIHLVPEHRVLTIRNGVVCQDFEGFSRAESRAAAGIPSKNTVIGVIARLIPEKGIINLLEAASLMKNINQNISFVIVGDGPSRSQFEGYRDRLGLGSYVRFLGHRDDVPFLLAGWDLFVLPTLSEGFSVSVLEAMAAHLPLVVSDLPSMREMVTPGHSGYLVRPKDSPGLAAAMLHITKDLPKARAMGEYNYQRVKRMFGTDRMVESTGNIYNELITREFLW